LSEEKQRKLPYKEVEELIRMNPGISKREICRKLGISFKELNTILITLTFDGPLAEDGKGRLMYI